MQQDHIVRFTFLASVTMKFTNQCSSYSVNLKVTLITVRSSRNFANVLQMFLGKY